MSQEKSLPPTLITSPYHPALCLYIVLSVLIVFSPIVFNDHHKSSASLLNRGEDLLQDSFFRTVVRITMASCFPLLFSVIQDLLFSPQYSIDVYRLCMGFAFLVSSSGINFFCLSTPSYPALMQVLYVAQIMLIRYPTMLLWNMHDNEIWTNKKTLFIIVFYAMERTCLAIYMTTLSEEALYVGICLKFIIVCVYVPCLVRWAYKYYLGGENISCTARLAFLYELLAITVTITAVGDNLGNPYTLVRGRFKATLQLIALQFMVLLSGRLARRDAVQSDHKLENKKAFVQYISHEARGPLSVANMGLELHLQDMMAMDKQIGDKNPPTLAEILIWMRETISHVEDIVDACSLAQTTLSDLLTFDKIEKSGMADMEKTAFLVLPMVESVVNAFSIQARYRSIELEFNYTKSLDAATYGNITVMADSSKIAQALRNLVSNALKFTPEKGKIKVVVKIFRKTGCFNSKGSSGAGIDDESYTTSTSAKVVKKRHSALSTPDRARSSNSGSAAAVVPAGLGLPAMGPGLGIGLGLGLGSHRRSSSDSGSKSSASSPTTPRGGLTIMELISRQNKSSTTGFPPGRASSPVALPSIPKPASNYSGHADLMNSILEDVSHPDRSSRSESISANANADLSPHSYARSADSMAVENLLCRIEVQDSGPGISKANITKLFGKFVQFDAAKMQQGGGSGLGLWLTRSIMESHGGGIGARSEGIPGKGSTFFIDIPLYSLQELDENGHFVPDRMLKCVSRGLSRVEEEASGYLVCDTLRSRQEHDEEPSLPSSVGIGHCISRSHSLNYSHNSSALVRDRDRHEDSSWTDYEKQQHLKNSVLAKQLMIAQSVRLALPAAGAGHSLNLSKSPNRSVSGESRSLAGSATGSPLISINKANSGNCNFILMKMSKEGSQLSMLNDSAAYSGTSTPSPLAMHAPAHLPPIASSAQSTIRIEQDPTSSSMSGSAFMAGSGSGSGSISVSGGGTGGGRLVSRTNSIRLRTPNSMLVMVVDDMASNRKVLRRAVTRQGRSIVCVEYSDGSEALEAVTKSLRSRPSQEHTDPEAIYYDIIFLDCQMGVMDGPVACKQMRELGYTGLIYGISGDARSIDTFKEAGANGGYTKPMKMDDLKLIFDDYKACLPGAASSDVDVVKPAVTTAVVAAITGAAVATPTSITAVNSDDAP